METAENKYITVAYKMYMVEDGEKEFGEEAPVRHLRLHHPLRRRLRGI